MATNTPKLNLIKPDFVDVVDISDLNSNMDILDNALVPTNIITPAANELLRYDGTDWVNASADATTSVAGVVKGTTSDGSNTVLGNGAFTSNTTGNQNTAVGVDALKDNTTGSVNTAVGQNAMQFNTTGGNNTAVGRNSLQNGVDGDFNVAVGVAALFDNEADNQVAVGVAAMQNNTTGGNNTAVGRYALYNNTTGVDNTSLGRSAGDGITTGSNNTTLGRGADPSTATVSNQVTLGNSSVATLRCQQTSITALSDVRDKTDIEETAHGLDLINKLRPVDFTWNTRDGARVGVPDVGFIAQELAEVEDGLGETDRLRLTLRDNPEKLEATPGRLLPVLVKAVQQLSIENDELKARLDKLENK